MYIRIRAGWKKAGEQDTVLTILKCWTIKELREEIYDKMDININKQRLFYQGKQLEDENTIMDYNLKLNDVVLLILKDPAPITTTVKITDTQPDTAAGTSSTPEPELKEKADSKYYKINDIVDHLEPDQGAWLEGIVIDIFKGLEPMENCLITGNKEPNLVYRVQNVGDQSLIDLTFNEIRPRSYYYYKKEELTLGQTVLANYNMDKPNSRGYWFDYKITKKTPKLLQGTILMGKEKTPHYDRTVKLMDEVLRIEQPALLSEGITAPKDIPSRKTAYTCDKCQDIPTKKCSDCGCQVCSGKHNSATIILCDECDGGYHITCLKPPLKEVPADPEWYCPECKVDASEIVQAGAKLKYSRKKAKMASVTSKKRKRSWGHGMATVGRSEINEIVPINHLGPVPGIEVGTNWRFRIQVSEAGLHRPHVSGIHGREKHAAYSIILSGGYEDDVDHGDEFLYTGSGGRDLSGNKRVNEQSSDQTLTRYNKALALNCNTPLNESGAEANDWRGGKPVRVVRNYRLLRYSKYAPILGNRYDGIYKVVKYFRERGKSGFYVWRYLLRRDDPVPAPWHPGGQNFDIIYPEKFLEAKPDKENCKPKKHGTERTSPSTSNMPKKAKIQPYKLTADLNTEIEKDTVNKKLWKECKEVKNEGYRKFLQKVEEVFTCICCQDVLYQPISMECKHNVCKICLKRSFDSEIYTCPHCRHNLTSDYKMVVNDSLQTALLQLFPGYDAKR